MILLNIAIAIAIIWITNKVTKVSLTDSIRQKYESEYQDYRNSLSQKEAELKGREEAFKKKEDSFDLRSEIQERRIEREKETAKRTYEAKYNLAIKDIEEREKAADRKEKEAEKLKNYYEGTINQLDKYIEKRCESYPFLAGMIADFMTLHYEKSSHFLSTKPRPAFAEACRIDELRRETRNIIAEKKQLEYKLAYIEKLFPNINDIFDSGFTEEKSFELETQENTDRVRHYLSNEEYYNLSVTDRNQLALDNYINSRKSKWQVGRDYEMYVGHMYEEEGYSVKYTGIIENLEDMGRDLIVSKDGKTYIIQCKNWSKEKTIHEKHIFQLFGTVTLYNVYSKTAKATGIFYSTTQLSNTATEIAKELHIEIKYADLGDFPRIKCNINRQTGEKIYHLPFDQNYDSTVIEKNKGECFAYTVKEAEDAGFRRTYKWHGQ